MSNTLSKICPPFFMMILYCTTSFCQVKTAKNNLEIIKHHDIHSLWKCDSINIEGGNEKIKLPDPIGFIGKNYRRFYIHYISIVKNKQSPYQYMVVGKTRVKNYINTFQGTITIKKVILFAQRDDPRYKQGEIICEIDFFEDSTKRIAGEIKGIMKTRFYLNKYNKIKYDAISSYSDGFSNNECVAKWTSYNTGSQEKCNWGDFRIPESGDLDIGAGEFGLNNKYISYGWDSYYTAWNSGNPDAINTQNAKKIELAHWWE
ncbi:MAG: hypothetical protein WCG87_11820 [Bacteroidota bacterium]